jgi:hypothetical protein
MAAYKTPAANRGAASLVYFNYRDAPSARLVRGPLQLRKFMQGYAFRVLLLRHRAAPGFLDLSARDERLADIVAPPTRTNFFARLLDLAAEGYTIDVFLFCHGWKRGFGGADSADAGEDQIENDDIAASLASARTGFTCMPIRIVWGTDCRGCERNAAWLGAGARAVSGSRATNFYPGGANGFIDAWNQGDVSFEQAVAGADTEVVRTVAQTWLAYVDAPAQKRAGRWGGCGFGKTVLGDDACAKAYFSACWALDGDWEAGRSGMEMMDISSFKVRGGDTSLTKNGVPRRS